MRLRGNAKSLPPESEPLRSGTSRGQLSDQAVHKCCSHMTSEECVLSFYHAPFASVPADLAASVRAPNTPPGTDARTAGVAA